MAEEHSSDARDADPGGSRGSDPGGADDRPAPRLPRGKGLSLAGPQLMRILLVAVLLFAVVFLRKSCGDSVARFMDQFDTPPDASSASVDAPSPSDAGSASYIELRGDMSEEELKKKLEQAGVKVDEPH